MESNENSSQDPLQVKLDFLDTMKFSSRTTRTTRKRKENPIEIKYEETTKSNLKEKIIEKETPKPINNRANFSKIYEKIKEMRKDLDAAVDEYGCHMNADTKALKDVQDFQLLVSLLISVQNRDESTAKAMERLKEFGLNAENINNTDEAKVLEVMGGVNFNKGKAKYIKAAAKLVVEKYNGKVPNDWSLLLSFPGVGNKIAIIFLNTAFNMNVGIGVDTHVHRVCNRIGLVNTKTPDQTRVELESFIPKDEWSKINNWFVGFGQQICLPIIPKCGGCLINDICNEGRKNLSGETKEKFMEKKKVKKIETKIEEFDDNSTRIEESEETKTTVGDFEVKEEEKEVYYTKQMKMNDEEFRVKEEAIEINLKIEETGDEVVNVEEDTMVKKVVKTKKYY